MFLSREAVISRRIDQMADHNDTIRRLFKGGGLLLVGLIAQLGISFVGKLLIARGLSVSDYGGVAIGMTIASMTGTLVLLGLQEGVSRYMPRYDNPADKLGVVYSAFSIAVPVSMLAGAAIFIAAPTIAPYLGGSQIAPVIRIFGLVVPLIAMHRLVVSVVQGQQRSTPKVLLENLLRPIARLGAIGIAIWVGISAVGIAWAYFIGWLLPVVLGLAYVYRTTDLFSVSAPRNPRRRELLTFSLPLMFSAALTLVYGDLDTALLGYFSDSPAPAGIYNVAYPLAMLLDTALVAFGFMFMPIVSEYHSGGESDRIPRIYRIVTKWIFVATLPVFLLFTFFPGRVITLTFGAKYAAGSTVLAVLAVGFFVNSVIGLNRETVVAIGESKIKMYADAGGAGMNLLLNLALIPTYGPLGAAVATSATYVALNIGLSAYLYRELGIVPLGPSVLRSAAIGILSFVVVTGVVRLFLAPSIPVLIAGFVVFLAIYGLAVVRFGGIDEEEVMLVNSIEERFGVDLEPGKRYVRRLMR